MNLTTIINYVENYARDLADMVRDPSPAVCYWTAGLAVLVLILVLA